MKFSRKNIENISLYHKFISKLYILFDIDR